MLESVLQTKEGINTAKRLEKNGVIINKQNKKHDQEYEQWTKAKWYQIKLQPTNHTNKWTKIK